ncbi:MAG: 23S rRNA (uracil(1939)-C(5))-methyltransferase RlmD [Parachlamydiaceae bacterium]|nr:23S rRNA (uracil(1939)-C(5))-methyltransferase RlmD [Parachlamydiaceae bacterium]
MYSKPTLNDKLSLLVQGLGDHGEGICDLNGYTLFVEGALPNEHIQAHITEAQRTYGRAHLDSITEASPDRVSAPCPIFNACGGCQIMHLSYEAQLLLKRQNVINAVSLHPNLSHITVSSCTPSPQQFAYRNKAQLPVAGTKEDFRIGLYARNSHNLVDVEACLVHCELGEKVYKIIRPLIQQSSLTPYDYSTGRGNLRHLLIKTAIHQQQVLVTLVTNGPVPLHDLANAIMQHAPEVKGLVQNINTQSGNTILGKEYKLILGSPHLFETLNHLLFRISSASFFQVNTLQAEQLYAKALQLADIQSHETVLDAYCGIGTLTLQAAQKAKKAIGIEYTPEAIEDAQFNASYNYISNVDFLCGPAEKLIQKLDSIDVVLLNPPRKGCERVFLEHLVKLKPRSIIYISCNPSSLARDLNFLHGRGYTADCIYPFDMFPQTTHVECVVKITQQ